MEWIEITARTLEQAIERALDTLGVHETELEYEVLAEAKTGLLGLRRTDARIRARVKPRSREKPNDKRRRQRDDQRSRRRPKDRPEAAEAGARSGPAPSGASSEARPAGPARDGAPSGGGSRPPRRRSRGGGSTRANDDNGARTSAPTTDPAPTRKTSNQEQRPMERSGSIDEQVRAGQDFATGLLEAFDAHGTVDVEPIDNEIEVRIAGDDLGLMVGPKGATLAALEELLRGAVGHKGPGRLHLDVAGYRAKRKAALADFARRVADDVKSSGTAKALEPMTAPDRKVVHDTIAALDGVSTISDGEDPRRRVIIEPA